MLCQEGFPFENDDVFGKKSDAGIKSHLEDLAKKHPEFANDLKCPPWGGSLKESWDKAFNVPISVVKDANSSADHQQSSSSQNQSDLQASSQESHQPVKEDTSSETAPADDGLKQHGLRNTVDIVELNKDQETNEEPKRASSAPPDTAPVVRQPVGNKPQQRFTSKIEITPVNPYEESSASAQSTNGNSGSSNTANAATDSKTSSNHAREIPIQTSNSENTGSRTSLGGREIPIHAERVQTHSPFDSPTMGRKQPQVRQIPIFVEGRKSPVMAREMEETAECAKQFQQEQTPLKRKLNTNSSHVPTSQPSNDQLHQKQQPPPEREVPVQPSPNAPQPPPPAPPPKPKDPMERIQEVKDEVDGLSNRIQEYSGKSRTDKDYLYLDEMLTRNLIKLDLVEVEGNDSLRTARKDVIKNIQKSIALLESKVPTSESGNTEGIEESAGSSGSTTNTNNSQTQESVNENRETSG